jgi:hypothetical protein
LRLGVGFVATYVAILAYAAWTLQRPQGTYTAGEQARRVAPVFVAPAVAYALRALLQRLVSILNKAADRHIAALQERQHKALADLKDSTRYEKTLALLKKYDPNYAPPTAPASAAGQRRGGGGRPSALAAPVGRAAALAAQTAHGAGGLLFPLLSQAWARAADTLIADDPVLVDLLRQAREQEGAMRQQLLGLQAENEALRRRLGIEPEDAEEVDRLVAAAIVAVDEQEAVLAGMNEEEREEHEGENPGGDSAEDNRGTAPPEAPDQSLDQVGQGPARLRRPGRRS